MICLKNNAEAEVFNGMICYVNDDSKCLNYTDETYVLGINSGISDEDAPDAWGKLTTWLGDINDKYGEFDYKKNRSTNRFDFGYAITAHKSQGSEFDSVLIINEPVGKTQDDRRRWLYTAITRAKNSVVLVDPS